MSQNIREPVTFQKPVFFDKVTVDGLYGNSGAITLNGVTITQWPSGVGGITNWGLIQGTLAAQTDLQNALNLKANSSDLLFIDSNINYLSGSIDSNNANINNVASVSGNWNSTYTTVQNNSSIWNIDNDDISVNTLVHNTSSNWNGVYSTVYTNSASWSGNIDLSPYATLSGSIFFGNICAYNLSGINTGDQDLSQYTLLTSYASTSGVYTTVQSNSTKWDDTYTTVQNNSSIWNLSGSEVDLGDIPSLSGNWNSVYTTFNSTSSTFLTGVDLSSYTLLSTYQETSGVYTTVQNNSGSWGGTSSSLITASIGCTFNGLGSVILPNLQTSLIIPYNCIIRDWTFASDLSGSIVVDIWKSDLINYPPTSANSIIGSQIPNINGNRVNSSINISSWTPQLSSSDVLIFNVSACTTITQAFLSLRTER